MLPRRHFIVVLILMVLPALAQAQFTFTTNSGSLTITGYTGPGGVVAIPGTNNNLAITGIGGGAFAYNTNITSIFITNSITNIEVDAFLDCSGLTNISVSTGNSSYSSIGNVLFDKAQRTLIDYPAGLTNGTYSIPLNVISIGPYAFAYCSSLTNMFIGINSIGQFGFFECTGLTSITILDQFHSYVFDGDINIGEGAFYGCASLTNVLTADGVTDIGDLAFANCTSLTSFIVPNTVTNLGDLAFANCTNLASAYFTTNAPPNNGTAFYGDPEAVVYYSLGMTGWGTTFDGAPTMGETPASEFQYEVNYNELGATITGYNGPGGVVVIPGVINGYTVTGIEGGPVGWSKVTSVIIPNTVTQIENGAFQYYSSLTNIVIPGSVASIPSSAFNYCINLKNVIIQNGVTSIGQAAFHSCTSLASITIPASVSSIGDYAFENCNNLTSAYFQGNAPPDDGTVFNGSPTTVYYLPGTMGWGATFGGAPTALWLPQIQPNGASFRVQANQFGFNINWASGQTVVVEAATNLSNPIWQPVKTNTLTGSSFYFSDPQWTNYPGRFYRVSGQ